MSKSGFAWYGTLENVLTISYKVQCTLTIWPSSPSPGNLPLINEVLCSHKNLYMNVYSLAFFVIAKNLETTHMSFSGWMVKQTVLRAPHVRPLSNKKERAVVCAAAWMDLKGIGSERSQSQKVTYINDTFKTKQNKRNKTLVISDGEQIKDCQKLGGECDNKRVA